MYDQEKKKNKGNGFRGKKENELLTTIQYTYLAYC